MGIVAFLVPILVSGLIAWIFDWKSPEFPKAKPGRLPLMLLVTVLLSVGGMFGYYLGGFALSFVLDGFLPQPFDDLILLLCMTVMAYILLLCERGLAKLLSLTKKNRMISLVVMIMLLLEEAYAAYVYISGSLI